MIETVEFRCGQCQSPNRLKTRQLLRMQVAPRCGSCGEALFRALDSNFSELNPANYQHPLDAEALEKLQHVPGIKTLLRKVIKSTLELNLRLSQAANTVQLSETQMPKVYAQFCLAAERLGLSPLPELYVVQNPYPNASTYGVEQYFVTITTGALELFDDEELLAIFAHELGHIHSDHMLYKTAARFISALATRLAAVSFGLGGLIALPLQLALLWWDRCAELTADRAALLVVRRPDVVFRVLMKMAGGTPTLMTQMNIDAFMEQAERIERMSAESQWARTLVFVQELFRTHPFPVYRARELVEWITTGNYLEILDGDFGEPASPGETCAQCGAKLRAEAWVCPHCGASRESTKHPDDDVNTGSQTDDGDQPDKQQTAPEVGHDKTHKASSLRDEAQDLWNDLFRSANAAVKGAGEVLREAADEASQWLQADQKSKSSDDDDEERKK